MRVVLVFLLCVCSIPVSFDILIGPQKTKQNQTLGVSSKEIIALAEPFPIEYRADIQLNAIGSGTVSSVDAVEILNRLYLEADGAQNRYRQRVVTGPDSMERELQTALFLESLDVMSLKIRIIKAVLSRNLTKAVGQLDGFHLSVTSTECQSALVPDLEEQYSEIGTIAAEISSHHLPAEKWNFKEWLDEEIQHANSPLQLAPVARLIRNSGLQAADVDALTIHYSSMLANVTASDRDLSAAMENHALTNAIQQLADRSVQDGHWPADLVNSYRRFLTLAAAQPQCADRSTDWTQVAAEFDKLSQDELGKRDANKLDVGEITKSRQRGAHSELAILPEDPAYNQLFDKVYRLREIEGSPDSSNAHIDSEAWQTALADFLSRVDAVDPSKAECQRCAYFAKGKQLQFFFDFAPRGFYKEKILDRFISLLASSPLESESRLLWLMQFKILLNTARQPTSEQEQQIQLITRGGRVPTMVPSGMGDEIRSKMKQANNSVMYVYASADALFKNKFTAPYLH